jgi:hypothetical protein
MWWKWNASAYVRPCHADARSASLRENRPPRYFRPFPARPSELGSPIRRRGGLRTPVTTAQRQLQRCLLLATGSWSTHVVEMECLGASSALPCGRTECVPPRKPPSASFPGPPPPGHPSSDHQSGGGAGSARPQGRHNANCNVASLWPPACLQLIRWEWNATACVRPCHPGAETAPLREKRLSRHPRALPARPPHLGSPPGGAGSARP